MTSNQRVSALVLNICSAYESGFGHGLDNTAAPNPYAPTDADSFGAWKYGHQQGTQRRSKAETKAPQSRCLAMIDEFETQVCSLPESHDGPHAWVKPEKTDGAPR